jgi:hypothetical protein
MSGQCWAKFDWRSILGAIAFVTGTVFIVETPAQALPEASKDSFKLAQVGVTSQINAPIPLNLKPRTHIPLPTNSSSSDYDNSYDESTYPHDHYRYHHHHRNNQNNGTVIIINPTNQSSYEGYSDRNSYIRIIRK